MTNLQYRTDVLKFFLALSASGKKGFISPGNLCGLPLRRIKTVAAKRCSAPFIGLSRNEIFDLLISRISRIPTGRKDPKSRVDFTEGIDATALVKSYQLSTSNHAIVGGTSPNDFITVKGLLKEQIFESLKECNKSKHGPMETEGKVVVVSFQNTPKRISPF